MSRLQVSLTADNLVTERDFWNRWFADFLENQAPSSIHLRHGEAVLRLLKAVSISRPNILEVGCANGWLSAALANFGQVTGVDIADAAIAAGQIRYPHINFIAGDFLTVALPLQHFDVVVSVVVISYFADQQLFLDRISSLLKPGGYLILACPHRFIWDRTDFIRRSHGEIPLKWLNMRDLKQLLRDHFSMLHRESIIPAGNRGILRVINSYRLNALIHRVVPEPYVMRLKEKMGLGKTLVVVAQKRR